MASITTLGLSSIQVAPVASDGGPGTTGFTAFGLTYQDSCKLTEEDGETTEFFAEEVEDAIITKTKKGKTTLTFSVMDPDATAMQKLFGGELQAGPPKQWGAPSSIPTIEKTVKIAPAQGMQITIVRGQVKAKINAEFSRKGLFLVDVTVTVLAPTKVSTASLYMTDPA